MISCPRHGGSLHNFGYTSRTAGFRSGLSSGPVLPNPTRVAAATAVLAPGALLASGALVGASWQAMLLLGVGVPYIAAYGLAM